MTSRLEEVERIIDEEYCTAEDIMESLERTEKGSVKGSLENCMYVLRHDPILREAIKKNEMTGRINLVKNLGWNRAGASITDNDEYQIFWYFEKKYEIFNERKIKQAISMVAEENKYHPIKEYLESLVWDGVPRMVKVLTKYLGVEENRYSYEVMHLLTQAMIHRIYEPGCKFEIMVCLVGGQGAGKSSFFRLLTSNDEWFTDDLKRLDDDKVYRKLQGHWMIEMSEMIATSNARSIEDIKSFISRQKDSYKIPYETHPEDRLRQCVFVGTSNNMDFLPLDRTGNRRFAPVLVHKDAIEKHILEDEGESREYMKQLWAEAYEIYRSDDKHVLKFSKETEEHLRKLQMEFMPEDTNAGLIFAWLDDFKEDYVCSRMIYKYALNHEYDEPKQWEISEINKIMNDRSDDWEKVSSHRFGEYGIQRGWRRISKDRNEFIQVNEQMDLPIK